MARSIPLKKNLKINIDALSDKKNYCLSLKIKTFHSLLMVSLFCSAYSDFDNKHRTKMGHFRHNLKN
jgi:hypothetical protein